MKWVDGGKAIFKVSTNVVSTVYTQVRPSSGFLQSRLTYFAFNGLHVYESKRDMGVAAVSMDAVTHYAPHLLPSQRPCC